MGSRRGLTLIELIVVIAITAIVLGLLLAGIQRIRAAAIRAHSMNNMRQIVLAAQNYAASHNSRLPSMDCNRASVNSKKQATLVIILPYLEGGFDYIQLVNRIQYSPVHSGYISPADPTYSSSGPFWYLPLTSYALNAQVFNHNPNLVSTFRDGTSNTIVLAEHYSTCRGTWFAYDNLWPVLGYSRRPTFADGGGKSLAWNGTPRDVYPDPRRPFPTVTFQAAPPIKQCDPHLAQTPHSEGMLVALADGSVRTLAPSISPATYWAAVTPSGGEIVRDEW